MPPTPICEHLDLWVGLGWVTWSVTVAGRVESLITSKILGSGGPEPLMIGKFWAQEGPNRVDSLTLRKDALGDCLEVGFMH